MKHLLLAFVLMVVAIYLSFSAHEKSQECRRMCAPYSYSTKFGCACSFRWDGRWNKDQDLLR